MVISSSVTKHVWPLISSKNYARWSKMDKWCFSARWSLTRSHSTPGSTCGRECARWAFDLSCNQCRLDLCGDYGRGPEKVVVAISFFQSFNQSFKLFSGRSRHRWLPHLGPTHSKVVNNSICKWLITLNTVRWSCSLKCSPRCPGGS